MIHSRFVKALLGTAVAIFLALAPSTASSTTTTVVGVPTQAVHVPSQLPDMMAGQLSALALVSPELSVTNPFQTRVTPPTCQTARAFEAENTNTYVIFCDGDDMGAGQVIDGCQDGLVLYLNGADCHFSCSCNGKGAMSCHMPDKYCGNDFAIASYCESPHAHFTCYCKSTSYPSATHLVTILLDRDITSTIGSNGLVLTTPTMLVSESQITPRLSGPISQSKGELTEHQELGENLLNEPKSTALQRTIQPSQAERPNEVGPLESSELSIGSLLSTGSSVSLLCSGTDLKKTYYVGVCMDGTLMYWSGSDCQSNCGCGDSGELQCEVDSDCGPGGAVAKACSSEDTFTCICLSYKAQKGGPVLAPR